MFKRIKKFFNDIKFEEFLKKQEDLAYYYKNCRDWKKYKKRYMLDHKFEETLGDNSFLVTSELISYDRRIARNLKYFIKSL